MEDNQEQHQVSSRLVEEGYVNLQDTMQKYRRARNQGKAAAGMNANTDPVVVLQDAVETFYHVIRPYMENEPRLAEYWHGALAKHPENQHASPGHALEYYRENSVGIWQTQEHTRAISAQGAAVSASGGGAQATLADGGEAQTSPGAWHDALGLSNSTRVLFVEPALDDDDFQGWYYKEGRFAVLGLRELKDWQVTTKKQRQSGAGFMAGEVSESEVRDPEPASKVETAAMMLIDVADELNAIASYEPSGERVHGTPVPDS